MTLDGAPGPMKPGFPATDLLSNLSNKSPDSYPSFLCETAAKQFDSFIKHMETWWKTLFALKLQGDKVQENSKRIETLSAKITMIVWGSIASPDGVSLFYLLVIILTGILGTMTSISCPHGTGKRVLIMVSAKSHHAAKFWSVFSPNHSQ